MTLKTSMADQLKGAGVKGSAGTSQMKYLVYDIESVVDKELVNEVLYPGEGLKPQAAFDRYLEEVEKQTGKTFPNTAFHVPVALAVAAVSKDYELQKLGLLGHEKREPGEIVKHFWDIYNHSDITLVDFNGSGYDARLMELWAFREGVSITPRYFQKFGPRYRYAEDKHLDLQDSIGNNGAVRYQGGLNLLAKLLNKPGKMETKGDMVQELYDQKKFFEIEDYCLGDVLDTYFVFLRWKVVQGALSKSKEEKLVKFAFEKAMAYSEESGYLKAYLDKCKEKGAL